MQIGGDRGSTIEQITDLASKPESERVDGEGERLHNWVSPGGGGNEVGRRSKRVGGTEMSWGR